jgi:capsid assembly protease
MTVADHLYAPWAIVPEKYQEIRAIYEAHLQGERIDLAAIEARQGKALQNAEQRYTVEDGVAIVPLTGVLTKRANMFDEVSGMSSYQLFARDLDQAVTDRSVRAILVEPDSPGGAVNGVSMAGDAMRRAAAAKPLSVLAGGMMASAAYWIGAQAGAGNVLIEDAVTEVGSIGVVMTHLDTSRAEEQRGVKYTDIVGGKYKRIAGSHAPLSTEGRDYLQQQVDYVYSEFIDAVAAARGVSVETVLADMADGRIFIGRQAVAAGLVDGIASRADLMADLRTRPAPGARSTFAVSSSTHPSKEKTMSLTREQLAADSPALLQQLLAEGRAEGHSAGRAEGHTAGLGEGRAEGAQTERERIQAVHAQTLPGHEKLITALMWDGKTSGPEAAVQVLNAERAMGADAGRKMDGDGVPPVKREAEADGADTTGDKKKGTTNTRDDAHAISAAARELINKATARGERLTEVAAVQQVMKERGNV